MAAPCHRRRRLKKRRLPHEGISDGIFCWSLPQRSGCITTWRPCCPIIDYHCHISPREIFEDLRYDNITQVWLGGDHYKWRLMRCAGVEEKYITGDASDHDKFLQWAQVLGKSIGNPLYHWSHLELRRFFGYEGILNPFYCRRSMAALQRPPAGSRYERSRADRPKPCGNHLHHG